MPTIIAIAIGGSFGALARFFLGRFVQNAAGTSFPMGTLVINLTGAFVIGFILELAERTMMGPVLRSFITIGFLGAYTTFSTYGYETVALLRDRELVAALLNVGVSTVGGLFLVVLGMYVARVVVR